MARTYLPTLIFLARAVYLYCTRNQQKILDNLDETGQTLFLALLAALSALLDAISPLPIGD